MKVRIPAPAAGKTPHSRKVKLRFALLFSALFVLSSLAWTAIQGTPLERLIIDQATVATSAQLIAMINPDQPIQAEGNRLFSTRVRLSVVNGCEGAQSALLLASAILAFPTTWRRKPVGLLLVTGCVFLLSQSRLIVLFFILLYKPEWFDSIHEYIAPIVLIIANSLIFTVWVKWADREKHHALAG